jgi:CheY-like chemotaxis protein
MRDLLSRQGYVVTVRTSAAAAVAYLKIAAPDLIVLGPLAPLGFAVLFEAIRDHSQVLVLDEEVPGRQLAYKLGIADG